MADEGVALQFLPARLTHSLPTSDRRSPLGVAPAVDGHAHFHGALLRPGDECRQLDRGLCSYYFDWNAMLAVGSQ